MTPIALATPTAKKPRDVRGEFFRGAALLIIFVAHVPGNFLGDWIPARFGLSDAAHMFVFISGYAAAIAFGGTFLRFGFLAGTGRIAIRCAQLYGAHIGLFVAVFFWPLKLGPRLPRSAASFCHCGTLVPQARVATASRGSGKWPSWSSRASSSSSTTASPPPL